MLTFVSVVAMVPAVWQGHRIVYTLSTIAPGISLNFRVDALSLIFGIVSSFLWIFASILQHRLHEDLNEHAQTRYYTVLCRCHPRSPGRFLFGQPLFPLSLL